MNLMKISDLNQKWDDLRTSKKYLQRLDSSHPLDFFVGIDDNGYKELVLITPYEPALMKSSKSVNVEKGKRQDGQWAIQIKLNDENNQEVFSSLCMDLIVSTCEFTNKLEGMQAVVARFLKWQKLLEYGSDGMSNEVIKGVVGELIFAEKVLLRKYNLDEVIGSWVGPDGADRDYVFEKEWFEVKAVATGKLTVGISSLNQLDIDQLGYLSIVTTDYTSETDMHGFSFSWLIEHFKKMLESNPKALFSFEEKLLNLGYYDRKEYHEKHFKTGEISIYTVDDKFPRLTPQNVNSVIASAKYDLIIQGLNDWKLEEKDLWS